MSDDAAYAFPLSYAQRRLWFLDQWRPGEATYNVPVAHRIRQPLDVPALARALEEVVRRHEILRTTYDAGSDGEPRQVPHPARPFPLPVVDLSETPDLEEETRRIAREEAHAPFDLARGSVLRARLLRLRDEEHVLLLTFHHIAADAWSLDVLARELDALYAAYSQGYEPKLEEPLIQYADYAIWQREQVDSGALEPHVEHWRRALDGLPVLDLPTDRPRPPVQTGRGASHRFRLPAEAMRGLRALAESEGATPFMALLAAWQALLHRLSGQEDFAVGAPIAGREQGETHELVGFFVNTLALRADFSDDPTFREHLRRARRACLDAFAHQAAPFDLLVARLRPERDTSRTPLVQAMMTYEEAPTPAPPDRRALRLEPLDAALDVAKFDVTLSLRVHGDDAEAALEYNADLFDAATAERAARAFVTLATAAAADPDLAVTRLPLLSAAEARAEIERSEGAAAAYPRKRRVHELFADAAARSPEAVALTGANGERVTYAELDARSSRLAHHLRSLGAAREEIVAVQLERGVALVVAQLAVLKAGAAYLPLDPTYPPERVHLMLEDARVRVVVSRETLERDAAAIAAHPSTPPTVEGSAEDVAYVMYTSGSTGRPKGVLVPHRAIARLVLGQDYVAFRPEEVLLQYAPAAFDAATFEVWGALLHGARLAIAPPGQLSAHELGDLLRRERVTTLWLTAPLFHLMVDEHPEGLADVRQLIAGGDALSVPHVEKARRLYPAMRLVNGYGPTECTTFAICGTVDDPVAPLGRVPIGHPLANTRALVLDRDRQPVPPGVAGELYLGGDGLARGYLGQDALTAERFVADPFWPGERLYRTGDLVRRLADGRLEFLGRLDRQLKVRGFRIEPGEIEAALCAHPDIRAALVLASRSAGAASHKRLVAYVVAPGAAADAASLRDWLRARLPEHMVPSAIVALDAFPLTTNGKIDHARLPPIDPPEPVEGAVAPATDAERALAEVWKDVLRVERVHARDNFFELGGDSILSIQVVARAARRGLRITTRQVFQHPTLSALAAVAERVAQAPRLAEQTLVVGEAPLTPIQRWFFEQAVPEPHRYNQSFLLRVRDDARADPLARATRALLLHHDALRTAFARGADGAWRQTITDAAAVEGAFTAVDLSHLAPDAALAALEHEADRLQGSLDLAKPPLLRVALFDLGVKGKRLLVLAHHLVVDGVSWRILLEDLEAAYAALAEDAPVSLAPKTTSLRDWARGLADAAQAQCEQLVEEWREWIPASVPDARAERVGPEHTFAAARALDLELDPDTTRALLVEGAKAYRAQANDVLLAALASAHRAATGRAELLLELEGHGREEELVAGADLSRTVGWFTALFPARLDVADARESGACLKLVKERLRAVPRRGVGYGLLRHLLPESDEATRVQGAPSPTMAFNHLGSFEGAFSGALLRGLAEEPKGHEHSPAARRPHPFTVTSAVLDGRLRVTLTYTDTPAERASAEKLRDALAAALRDLARHLADPEAGGSTPSDFPLARLDAPTLDRVVAGRARDVADIYPLTPLQDGMLFHALLEPRSPAYFEQVTGILEGDLDADAFEAAWRDLVARHDALRTELAWEGLDRRLQVVRRSATLPFERHDWRDADEAEAARRLADLLARDRARGFDLARAPLARVALVRLSERRHRLVWSFHHAILDGWSLPVLVRDLLVLYAARRREDAPALAAPRPFRAFIEWLARVDRAAGEAHWRGALAGFTTPTRLPCVHEVAPGREDEPPGEAQTALDAEATARLHALAREEATTPSALVQAAWALVLARHARADDVVFGATVSGRPAEIDGVEGMVGLFINTVPVRVQVREPESPREWLRRLRDEQAAQRGHEHHPLVDVQAWSDAPRGEALFDTLVVFENYPVGDVDADGASGLTVRDFGAVERTNYPVTVVAGGGERLVLKIAYDTARVETADAECLLAHLRAALAALVEHADRSIAEADLLAPDDAARIESWSGVDAPFDERPVHVQVAAHARHSPDAIAVEQGAAALTYAELDARAERLARRLHALGVGRGAVVALLARRSPEFVVGALAALKAGAAYLPLDPAHPDARLRAMADDARVAAVLSQRALLDRLPTAAPRVLLDEDAAASAAPTDARLAAAAGEDAAYVIYTSGSTGRPKGVAVPHRALANLVHWHRSTYGVSVGDRGSLLAGLSFDAAAWECWGTLAAGASLVLPDDDDTRLDAPALARWLGERRVGVAFAPTPVAEQLVRLAWPETSPLRWLLTGGDALRRAPARALPFRLANHYGPTEATVLATACEVAPDGAARPPIGRPIRNARVEVLDPAGRRAPPGVPGEIHLGGVCLALGYLGRPVMTEERFVADPLRPGARLYRTGDLGRWRDDGTLEFLGRIDEQVKVRGIRVEPAEVEVALAAHPAVRSCAVLAQDSTEGKRLVAYLASDVSLSATELRAFLLRGLPEAMVPSAFVSLGELPLTPNGKIDRRALALTQAPASETPREPPATPSEEILAGLWADALGGAAPGRDDDFFASGGHSLVATRLVGRIRAAFGVDLPLRALFETPTLRTLATRIDAGRGRARPLAALPSAAPRDAPLPLSSAQQRLWFLHAWDPESPLYNVAAALRVRGPLDAAALEAAFDTLVSRHEVLRTTYCLVDGAPAQRVQPHAPFRLRVDSLAALAPEDREAEARRLAAAEARRPFDLVRGPVLRARLLRLAPEEHVLLLVVHHIAFDGASLGVLVRELSESYAARLEARASRLPALAAQVADLALAERSEAEAAALADDLAYWRDQLRGVPALDLPTDHPRPAARTFRGGQVRFRLSRELGERLRDWSRREGATGFMTLLAVIQALLHRHSGQADFAVGSPVAGRLRAEAEPLVGFFVNTLVLRADVSGDPSLRELLARVRATCLDAYAHQRAPFERIVGELAPERDLSRSPLFQVMLAVQEDDAVPAWPGLSWEALEIDSGTSKFDLTFSLHGAPDGGYDGLVEHSLDLFEPSTARALARRFEVLLDAALSQPDAPVSRLPLLEPEERAATLRLGAADAGDAPEPRDTLHALFEAQARRRPDAEAVSCGDIRLTYAELDARASRLARRLRGLGVRRGSLVGLCLERSVDLAVAVLGILKAGGAYVPLDPAYPPERLAFMLEDARAAVVVTDARAGARLPEGTRLVHLEDVDTDAEAPPIARDDDAAARPEDLAYVIYTSGSTGRPKGVLVEHRHVARLFSATDPWFGFDERDGWTLFHSIAFDFSVWEMWGALLHGGRLVVVPHEVARDADAFHALLRDEHVTVLNQTPSAFRPLMAADERAVAAGAAPLALRHVVFGGEALDTAGLRGWFERHGDERPRLVNMYGITETTVHVTYRPVTRADAERGHVSPIGRPIPDLKLLLLDERLEPVPVGVPGEIFVGGAGVARGYLHRPELDAARFVPDPHERGARLYRSGDLARWTRDDDLEYLGRLDQQVKIRGFRIELGEVEGALLAHPAVREAVVLARDDTPGERRLVAYVVARGAESPNATELRAFLRDALPEHMIPAAFVGLPAIPLTPNGKVDRRALPAPALERPDLAAAYVPPATRIEEKLARAWAATLRVARVGRHDNFFELGGDSLLAVKAVVAAEAVGLPLKPRHLFERQTVAELAAFLEAAGAAAGADAATTLVPLRARGSRTPFFLVHPAGGTVGCYARLALALDPERPVYALQAVGTDDDREPHETIEEMARAYVRDARAGQPRGPYLLGGWSYGGVVALEMARQLAADGDEVALLALVDPGLPPPDLAVEKLRSLAKRCESLATESATRGADESEVARLREDLSAVLTEFGAPPEFVEVGLEGVRRYLKVFDAQIRAAWRYQVPRHDGVLTLLVTDQAIALNPGFAHAWRAYARDVRETRLAGDHWSAILDPEHLKTLAATLDAALRACDPTESPR